MTKQEEKQLGVKTVEKETTTDTHQSEEKSPDFIGEIDGVLSENKEEESEFNVDTTDYDDKSVVISKKDLEILKKKTKAGEYYKTGLLSLKDRLKSSKKEITKKIPEDKVDVKKEETKDYLSKSEYLDSIEKEAIAKACENEIIEQHWADIMAYYVVRRGKNSVANIMRDIQDAYTLYVKDNPSSEDEEDKDVVTELSTDKTKIKKGIKTGGKERKKKSILKKETPVSDWY